MRFQTSASRLCLAATGVLMVSYVASPAHAQTTMDDLAREIAELKAENRAMRGQISDLRESGRRTSLKVKAVAARTPAPNYQLPPPAMAIPVGATPAFVTADKKLQFGAITITPGGFLAAESVFRSRTTQSDINTSYGAIPLGANPLAHQNETRLTGRQSRIALLAEGNITPTFVAGGYIELDFLGAAQTANSNEANGYQPRIRHLYATLDNSDYGMHVLAGQNWSLVTLNSKGITPRNEVTPPTIDGQYVPGFAWARQAQIRFVKDFGQKLWVGISAEESATTFATACGTTAAGTNPISGNFNGNVVTGQNCTAAGTGGGFSNLTNYSTNHIPDIVGKVAYEARIADRDVHFEALGLYRDFYNRVAYTNTLGFGQNVNRDTTGYGVGGGIIVPVIPKRLDFQASGLYGRGIGRYGTSGLSDTTLNADGSLRPIQEGMLLGGLTYHATPAIDIYGFAGIEKSFRTYTYNGAGGFYGFGAPGAQTTTASSVSCGYEANTVAAAGLPASTCNGATRSVFQLTGGFWDKIYKGAFGEVRVGAQYSFTERTVFNNTVGVPGVTANNFAPKAYDHMIFTSLRYYPFQ